MNDKKQEEPEQSAAKSASPRNVEAGIPEIALDELRKALEPKLRGLPPDRREEVVATTFEATLQFSGPIPHPGLAAGYEQLMPGATDRLFSMAERQLQMSERALDAQIAGERDHREKNQAYRLQGLWAGALVSLALIGVGGCVAIFADAPITGAFVSLVGVGTGLAGLFVKGCPLNDTQVEEPEEQKPPNRKRKATAKTSRSPNKR